MSTAAIGSIAVAGAALLIAISAIRIVREYQRVVVFRLGRLRGQRGPGLVLIIPLIERTRWVNLQVDTAHSSASGGTIRASCGRWRGIRSRPARR